MLAIGIYSYSCIDDLIQLYVYLFMLMIEFHDHFCFNSFKSSYEVINALFLTILTV